MDPFNPWPGDRPGHQQQKWNYQEPREGSNTSLWVIGIIAGALGIAAVISAI